jgi:hypothetical protein
MCFGISVALALGCTNEGPVRSSHVISEAGSDQDALDARARTVRDSAQTSDSAAQCAAPHIPGSTDAAATRADADASFPPNDAAAPPTDCLAPCVWDLVKNCLPRGQCISQVTEDNAPVSFGDVICVPGTGWTGTRHGTSARIYGRSVSIYVDNRFCYGFSESQMSGVLGLYGIGWTPSGTPASVIGGPLAPGVPGIVGSNEWGPIACGTRQAFAAHPECASTGPCPAETGITFYDIDPDQPHCAPWRDIAYAAYGMFRCTEGCCP